MLRTKILEERKAIFEQGVKQGVKQGVEKGMEEGVEIGLEKVAERGIKNGFSDEMIHTLTGLDIKKIKDIRKRLEQS